MLRLGLLSLAIAAVVAACSDPTISIELEFVGDKTAAMGDKIADQHPTLTVSVIDAESAGATLETPGTATCDDMAFGLISPDVLEGARRASVSADESSQISGVPRLGEKLVVVEAKVGGHRIAAGCTPLHAVERDTPVPVAIEIAPRVQEIGRLNGADDPFKVAVIATAPWNDALTLERDVRFQLYGTTGRPLFDVTGATTAGTGIAMMGCHVDGDPPCDPTQVLPHGPLQKIVRVKWAEEPLRIAAFEPLLPLPGSPITVVSATRGPAIWKTGPVRFPNDTTVRWAAIALHNVMIASVEHQEVVFVQFKDGRLQPSAVPADRTRAITIWNQQAWTLLDDGWYQLSPDGLPATPDLPDNHGPAAEIVPVTSCDGTPPLGLLVRRAAGDYLPYTDVGAFVSTGPISDLATAIGGDRVVNQLCAKSMMGAAGSPERLVIVLAAGALRAIRIANGQVLASRPFPLPQVATMTDYGSGDTSGLAGAITTQSGPRVVSFRFATYEALLTDVAVPTTAVDAPVATTPTSILVANLDGEGTLDVLALLPTPIGLRVQAVMGTLVAGQPLAATSDTIPVGRDATDSARLVLENVVGASDGCLQLVLLTPENLIAFSSKLVGQDGPCATR